MNAISGAALHAAIRADGSIEAQKLLNLLSDAKSVDTEVVSSLPADASFVERRAARDAEILARLQSYQPGVLSVRAMLEIVADYCADVRPTDDKISTGFVEGLAAIILRTPLEDLAALLRELLTAPQPMEAAV